MSYTKGEWEVDTKKELDGYYIACRAEDGEGESVAFAFSMGNEETLANAYLISAASDMHKAMKEYLEWGVKTSSDRDLLESSFKKALAKAEGKVKHDHAR